MNETTLKVSKWNPQGTEFDFDWTVSPWFLEKEWEEQLWGERYEQGDLKRARDALAKVFPPAFCQAGLYQKRVRPYPWGFPGH